MPNRPIKPKRNKLVYILPILLVVIVAAGAVTWKLTSKKTSINPTGANTASQNTKGETAAGSSGKQSTSNGTYSGSTGNQSKSSPNATDSSQPVETPTGNFVSDHHPNLSGSPAPNKMASSCTTTPGASCQISFTKDGVTKSLGPEKTDTGGSAYWDWSLQGLGLTQGTWLIKATASLNGNSKDASDPQSLVVAQ